MELNVLPQHLEEVRKTASMLYIANWKQKLSVEEQVVLAKEYANITLSSSVEGWVLPREEAMVEVAHVLAGTPWRVGAQMWTPACEGMCALTLVGHASRRAQESASERVAQVRAATEAGARVVVCVGEQVGEDRESIIVAQLMELVTVCSEKTLIAYEPLWAIGTGNRLIGDDLVTAIQTVKRAAESIHCACEGVLYGGSVGANALTDVQSAGAVGVLVGTASWSKETWLPLVEAAKMC